MELETPHGPARVHLHAVAAPAGALVLGHGAGGGVTARDLAAATSAANAEGFSVALVEQPYRVAGRRSPPRAPQLDAAWTAVLEQLRAGPLCDLPLVCGGRSSGARVACRTAAATRAAGVLCLAFPLRPPRRSAATPRPLRRPATTAPQDRQGELDAVAVPVLVIQGESDPFGMPPDGPGRTVVALRGDHRLASDLPGLAAAVRAWLPGVLSSAS